MSVNSQYNDLINEFFLHTIPNTYFILKFIKACGYAEILMVPKYYNIAELQKLITIQFGKWMSDTVYYINDDTNEKIFIHELQSDILIIDLLRKLKWAYNIDECIHNVHILYYGTCECNCSINCAECL
jgi:hypothetical protein